MTKKIKNIAFHSLMVVLGMQLWGCAAAGGIEPSKTTCNQFLTQMQAHKYSVAYGLLSTTNKSLTTAQQLQNYWELVEKNRGKVQSWGQQGINIYSGTGGSNVRLTYSLQCEKGASSATFVCMPENDKWLIQGANFAG